MARTNILVLGKSGAGKSSLLNYLLGDFIAKTGAGRPVTERSAGDEIGIYKSAPIKVGDRELVVYDSWGMEADKADEWNDIIRRESQKREDSNNIEDWFHAVIYCVSAKGARIEEFEIRKVVQPLMDAGHSVAFALTKCGIASDNERQSVRAAIQAACPNHGGIIEVESVPVTLRGRSAPTVVSGKEDLLNTATQNFAFNLREKLRKKYLAKCEADVSFWRARVLAYYDKKASFLIPSAVTLNDVASKAVSWLDDTLAPLEKWRAERDAQASEVYKAFGALSQQLATNASFLRRSRPLSKSDIEWEVGDHVASVIMNLVPVLNVAYWAVRKDMHRDTLRDKLQKAVDAINEQAQGGFAPQSGFDDHLEMLTKQGLFLASVLRPHR